jgi:DNA-binding XRE family transcriptional regulator
MDVKKRKKLESAGWKVGSTSDFLELSEVETQLLEIKLSLVRMLRLCRERNHLTQAQLAKKIKSSQSRVAKMEAGDPSVSLDLLMRSLLAAGANRRQLARAIGVAQDAGAA